MALDVSDVASNVETTTTTKNCWTFTFAADETTPTLEYDPYFDGLTMTPDEKEAMRQKNITVAHAKETEWQRWSIQCREEEKQRHLTGDVAIDEEDFLNELNALIPSKSVRSLRTLRFGAFSCVFPAFSHKNEGHYLKVTGNADTMFSGRSR
jgi:hypothetical protein